MAGQPVEPQISAETQAALDQIGRWLREEVAQVLDRADRVKITLNIKGSDVQPVIEAFYKSL